MKWLDEILRANITTDRLSGDAGITETSQAIQSHIEEAIGEDDKFSSKDLPNNPMLGATPENREYNKRRHCRNQLRAEIRKSLGIERTK